MGCFSDKIKGNKVTFIPLCSHRYFYEFPHNTKISRDDIFFDRTGELMFVHEEWIIYVLRWKTHDVIKKINVNEKIERWFHGYPNSTIRETYDGIFVKYFLVFTNTKIKIYDKFTLTLTKEIALPSYLTCPIILNKECFIFKKEETGTAVVYKFPEFEMIQEYKFDEYPMFTYYLRENIFISTEKQLLKLEIKNNEIISHKKIAETEVNEKIINLKIFDNINHLSLDRLSVLLSTGKRITTNEKSLLIEDVYKEQPINGEKLIASEFYGDGPFTVYTSIDMLYVLGKINGKLSLSSLGLSNIGKFEKTYIHLNSNNFNIQLIPYFNKEYHNNKLYIVDTNLEGINYNKLN